MKAIGRLSVFPTLPRRIQRLDELSYNLWWTWYPEAQSLYRDIDPASWTRNTHNPIKLLRDVSQARLNAVAEDPQYLARYDAVLEAFDAYMNPTETWFERTYQPDHEAAGRGLTPCSQERPIAYFSAEFGLHEALPIYSGGLGVLSGDFCKAASDLGLPFVAVGFLYPQGYFRQQVDREGNQRAFYRKLDLSATPARPARDAKGEQVMISVELPGRIVHAKVWEIRVGRISLYLMDTDVDPNAPEDRELAARLYGGDHEMRISQEMVLGIGGVRALRALHIHPGVWHMNEGHSAFLVLERARELVQNHGLDFATAREVVAANTVFTTHTPVPAGHDAFTFDLMRRYFHGYWWQLGLDEDSFLSLARHDQPWGPTFSMTVLALRLSGQANGVSELHGQVSREMWHFLWPDLAKVEVPISHITNGVHNESWLAPALGELFDRYFPPGWRERLHAAGVWQAVDEIPDAELWETLQALRTEMVEYVRTCLQKSYDVQHVNGARHILDPTALTIGFARRFATYKRATLIFKDIERIKRLLNDPAHPVQIIFAGKAHPADEPGKALIREIYQYSQQPDLTSRVVFLEDYDMNMARHLVQGVDLWLNNPRRPLEASGTSGQKAAMNGSPNLSVLDGWWREGYDETNGWAIGEERPYPDAKLHDEADALSLYMLLEDEVVPTFYQRDNDGVPREWLRFVRAAIRTCSARFSMRRMAKEYTERMYVRAARAGYAHQKNSFAKAREVAAWLGEVREAWDDVRVAAVSPQEHRHLTVGEGLDIEAEIHPGRLDAGHLCVELVYGHAHDNEVKMLGVLPMELTNDSNNGSVLYRGHLRPETNGELVYGVRVLPEHPDVLNKYALGLVHWA